MSPQLASSSRQRYTAAQIAQKPSPEPAIGERLYVPTNELQFSSPILGLSGRYGDEVYHWRGGKCFVRRYVVPRPPSTGRQIAQQDRMRVIMPSWTALPDEVRRAWLDYSILHYGEVLPGVKQGNRGQNLYTSAQSNRLAWGDVLSSAPPAAPPPPRVIQLVEVPAPAGQVAWRIDHGLTQPTGYRLEVRMTPAAGPDAKPALNKLVRAGATTAGSFFPLQASGSVYLLEQPLHTVETGQRYGLQVKLITPDGVEGRPLVLDLTRKAPGVLPADSAMPISQELNAATQQPTKDFAPIRQSQPTQVNGGVLLTQNPERAGQDPKPSESHWTRPSPAG